MAGQSAGQANEKNKNAATAKRIAHLRQTRFETEGFKSNEPVPSVAAARAMASRNRRQGAALTPIPRAV